MVTFFLVHGSDVDFEIASQSESFAALGTFMVAFTFMDSSDMGFELTCLCEKFAALRTPL